MGRAGPEVIMQRLTGHRHPERQGHTACSGIPAGALPRTGAPPPPLRAAAASAPMVRIQPPSSQNPRVGTPSLLLPGSSLWPPSPPPLASLPAGLQSASPPSSPSQSPPKDPSGFLIFQLRNTFVLIENRLGIVEVEEGGRGMDKEFEISRYKLLYTGWINNKVLLYSPGNYIQYPGINHNGKEYKKECIYVYN